MFTCNICGAANKTAPADVEDREKATCTQCRSSTRFRSLLLVLSRALFGTDLIAPDFPILKSVRGFGISDSDIYSSVLEKHFTYTNTYFHREPRFDLIRPDEREFGRCDFVICSEVLEHIPDPVSPAIETLVRLLKPAGLLILTVPYTLGNATVEHFPGIHSSGLAEVDGKTVLVSRGDDGSYRVFDRLAFHGGRGQTLEMRVFAQEDLKQRLRAAGLADVQFDSAGNRDFGIVYSGPCSLPVIARRQPFALGVSGISELVEQLTKARRILDAARSSHWLRLGRSFSLGPKL